jgi:hypothetical protein
MEVLKQKQELVDWILSLENKNILNDIYKIKKQSTAFNFDEEFKKGITVEEFRTAMKTQLKNYSLKE